MIRTVTLLLFIFLWVRPLFAYQIDGQSMIQLAQHPTWLKLLHMDKMQHSQVTSTDFFLSPHGQSNAKAELLATLATLGKPSLKERLPVMCKFPARYTWLAQQIQDSSITKQLKHCVKLHRWIGDNDEVSLILVSGYLGNPASTFGHALLKLHASNSKYANELLDTAINYGAKTPKGEPTLRYVYKGLVGGYKATFLDKYYYTQDLMYSKLESRDMWAYTLNLPEDKARFLMYHIWELVGEEFDYYFLDENCAYQLIKLLELVIDEPLIDKDMAWYVPIEGFQRLEAIDKAYKKSGRDGIIKSVVFLPSNERRLYEQLMRLKEDERVVVDRVMNNGAEIKLADELKTLPQASQQNVLDALLTFYNYEMVKSGLKPNSELKSLKQQVLLARFALPARADLQKQYINQPSPSQSFKTMLLGLGLGRLGGQDYLRLHATAYNQDSTGRNNLHGDELVLLDGVLGVPLSKGKAIVEQLDFIRIRKLNVNSFALQGDAWAWQMRIGLGLTNQTTNTYDGIASFGAGKTWKVNSSLALYVMTDAAIHTDFPHLRLRPHLGMYHDWGNIKALWYAGLENITVDNHFKKVWGGQVQYHAQEQLSVVLQYKRDVSNVASVEVRSFW